MAGKSTTNRHTNIKISFSLTLVSRNVSRGNVLKTQCGLCVAVLLYTVHSNNGKIYALVQEKEGETEIGQ